MHKHRPLIQKVLNRHPDIKLCIVFGSIAAGKASSNSDLDIAIAAEQTLPDDKYMELIEEFSIATNREIDLVDLMAATGPILIQALSTGMVVQNHDKSLYARLISRQISVSPGQIFYWRKKGTGPRSRECGRWLKNSG